VKHLREKEIGTADAQKASMTAFFIAPAKKKTNKINYIVTKKHFFPIKTTSFSFFPSSK